jgi:hypothetical protein
MSSQDARILTPPPCTEVSPSGTDNLNAAAGACHAGHRGHHAPRAARTLAVEIAPGVSGTLDWGGDAHHRGSPLRSGAVQVLGRQARCATTRLEDPPREGHRLQGGTRNAGRLVTSDEVITQRRHVKLLSRFGNLATFRKPLGQHAGARHPSRTFADAKRSWRPPDAAHPAGGASSSPPPSGPGLVPYHPGRMAK